MAIRPAPPLSRRIAEVWFNATDSEKFAMVGLGTAIVGGIAYLLTRPANVPATTLGSGGSSTILGPAATTQGTAAGGSGMSPYTPVGPLPPGSPGQAYQDQINQQWGG
jgi:hypothetical protein